MINVIEDSLKQLAMTNGRLHEADGTVFDMSAYSKFKYGETTAPVGYGLDLVRLFLERYPDLALATGKVLITPTSYKYLPTPAMGIARAFMRALNIVRVQNRLEPAMMIHIIRSQVGMDTYAMVSQAERLALLSQGTHHFDAGLIKDSTLIAIDDVKVTGATQQRMHQRLLKLEPATIAYLFMAAIDPAYALSDAGIEAVMNNAYVNSLDEIAEHIRDGRFQMNSRVCGFIIKQPDHQALAAFLREREDAFLEQLYDGLTCSSAEMYGRNPSGTRILEDELVRRNLPIAAFIRTYIPTHN